jgi:hypothetical protein
MPAFKDLSGQRFGKLTVIRLSKNRDEHGELQYVCFCDCDSDLPVDNRKIHIVSGRCLRKGYTKSCGCLKHQVSKNYQDISGMKFGRFEVIKKSNLHANDGKTLVECYCDCDNHLPNNKRKVHLVKAYHLKKGIIVSCGCYKDEQTGIRASIINKTHGMSNTPEYYIYHSMIQRCINPNHKAYHRYGGRGITICDKWLEPNGQGFMNFFNDMGKRPNKTVLDRIDVDGNYVLDNCHWTTVGFSVANRSSSVIQNIEDYLLIFELYNDQNKTLTEIGQFFECSVTTIKEIVDGKTYEYYQQIFN